MMLSFRFYNFFSCCSLLSSFNITFRLYCDFFYMLLILNNWFLNLLKLCFILLFFDYNFSSFFSHSSFLFSINLCSWFTFNLFFILLGHLYLLRLFNFDYIILLLNYCCISFFSYSSLF